MDESEMQVLFLLQKKKGTVAFLLAVAWDNRDESVLTGAKSDEGKDECWQKETNSHKSCQKVLENCEVQ